MTISPFSDSIILAMKMSFRNGIFFGILIGVASAFLYTPKSGKEIREELKDKLESVPFHFMNFLESLLDLGISVLDFAKDAFYEQNQIFSNAISSGVNAAKEKASELKAATGGHSLKKDLN